MGDAANAGACTTPTHQRQAGARGRHPPPDGSERLGHAGITIALDLYAHVLPSIEKAAALQVGALFVPPLTSSSQP